MAFGPRNPYGEPTRPSGPLSILTGLLQGVGNYFQAKQQTQQQDQQNQLFKQAQDDKKYADEQRELEPYAQMYEKMGGSMANPQDAAPYYAKAADVRARRFDPRKTTATELPALNYGGTATPPPATTAPAAPPSADLSQDLLSRFPGHAPAPDTGTAPALTNPLANLLTNPSFQTIPQQVQNAQLAPPPLLDDLLRQRLNPTGDALRQKFTQQVRSSLETPTATTNAKGQTATAGGSPNLAWGVSLPATQTLFSGLPKGMSIKEEQEQARLALEKEKQNHAMELANLKGQLSAANRIVALHARSFDNTTKLLMTETEKNQALGYDPRTAFEMARGFLGLPEHYTLEGVLNGINAKSGRSGPTDNVPPVEPSQPPTTPASPAAGTGPNVSALPPGTSLEDAIGALVSGKPVFPNTTAPTSAETLGNLAAATTAQGPAVAVPAGIQPGLQDTGQPAVTGNVPKPSTPATMANPLAGDVTDPARRAFVDLLGLPLQLQGAPLAQPAIPANAADAAAQNAAQAVPATNNSRLPEPQTPPVATGSLQTPETPSPFPTGAAPRVASRMQLEQARTGQAQSATGVNQARVPLLQAQTALAQQRAKQIETLLPLTVEERHAKIEKAKGLDPVSKADIALKLAQADAATKNATTRQKQQSTQEALGYLQIGIGEMRNKLAAMKLDQESKQFYEKELNSLTIAGAEVQQRGAASFTDPKVLTHLTDLMTRLQQLKAAGASPPPSVGVAGATGGGTATGAGTPGVTGTGQRVYSMGKPLDYQVQGQVFNRGLFTAVRGFVKSGDTQKVYQMFPNHKAEADAYINSARQSLSGR